MDKALRVCFNAGRQQADPGAHEGEGDRQQDHQRLDIGAELHAQYGEDQQDADARLEAATGTVITMKLNVKGKQGDNRKQVFDDNPENQIVLHGLSRSFRLLRRPPISSMTPMPAVKITITSPRVS